MSSPRVGEAQGRPPLPWIGPSMIFLFLVIGGYFVSDQSKYFHQSRGGHPNPCISNQKQILLGALMYSGDFDDKLPLVARWTDHISAYLKREDVLHCRADGRTGAYGHTIDSRIGDIRPVDFDDPANRAYLFDSTSAFRNASDPLTSPRFNKVGNLAVGWLDGHVSVKSSRGFKVAVSYAAGAKP